MTELQASRTLVKSPPELWAECSDAASLARHLGQFGEIRITRLDPETAVAWEGEHARGTVRIEPAGWGTRVILTATAVGPPVVQPAGAEIPAEEPVAADVAVPEPVAADAPVEDPAVADVAVEEPLDADGAVDDPPAVERAGFPSAADGPGVTPPSVESPPRRRRFARLLAFLRGPAREPEVGSMNPDPVAAAPPGAEIVEPRPESEVVEPVPEPEAVEPVPEPDAVEPVPEPEAVEFAAAPAPAPPATPPDTEAALAAALDSLGQAHHRPYSRA